MLTMLGTLTTTSVLILAEATTGVVASTLGRGRPAPRSWLQPARPRAALVRTAAR